LKKLKNITINILDKKNSVFFMTKKISRNSNEMLNNSNKMAGQVLAVLGEFS
jgi:hypothetical protein